MLLSFTLLLFDFTWQSKIVRVLNLWQKNGVFKIEVIQPLLDMAAGSSSGAAPFAGTDEPGKFCQAEIWNIFKFSFLIYYAQFGTNILH